MKRDSSHTVHAIEELHFLTFVTKFSLPAHSAAIACKSFHPDQSSRTVVRDETRIVVTAAENNIPQMEIPPHSGGWAFERRKNAIIKSHESRRKKNKIN